LREKEMPITLAEVKNSRQWRSTTGLEKKQFEKLSVHFEKAYQSIYGTDILIRKGSSSQESAFKTYEDWLFFLLFSLKSGVTYDVLGVVFGCDGSTAKKNQKQGLSILRAALIDAEVMPARSFENVVDFEKWLENEPVLILDGTEQRSQRPTDNDEQKAYYSGKKKPIP
jgi:hypothetical protein